MTTKFFCRCGKSFRKENYFKIHQNNCISINFEEKINPYIKNSLKDIEIISGVPKVAELVGSAVAVLVCCDVVGDVVVQFVEPWSPKES